jgi:hypothetical protein
VLDFSSRFHFGLNLDDTWRYAGVREPKSILIPHLLSLRLPEGRLLDIVDEEIIRKHMEAEPADAAERATLALADTLADAKVDFVRCWFPWRFFEPKPVPLSELDSLLEHSYSSWPTDNLVRTLTDRGIGVVPVVGCGYSRMLPEGLNVDRYEEYLRRIAVHARLLVRRYRDRVRYWQIENEPDWWEMHVAGGWRSGAIWVEQKLFRPALLRTLNEAVHSEDGSAQTIVNLEGDAERLDPKAYSVFCDIVTFDFYPNYRSPSPINLSVFRRAEQAAKDLGGPVVIMETGYPSGPEVLGYDEKKQAEYVSLACAEAHSLEGVNGVGIWRYIDTSWKSFPEQENHFGLFDSRGRPKQAWGAFVHSISDLRG